MPQNLGGQSSTGAAPEMLAHLRHLAVELNRALGRELVLVLFLVLCFGVFRQVPLWNEPSRYDLVVALVEDHTTQIDRYQQNTGDKAFYHGHYYSDKLPGSSLLGIPAYLVLREFTELTTGTKPATREGIPTLAFAVSGLPTVVLAMLLLSFLRSLVDEWWAIAMTCTYALGTLAFPYATMYFGHAATTCLLFAAFYVLWRRHSEGDRWPYVAAGCLAGFAVLVDISALIAAAPILLYGQLRTRRPVFLLMAAGGVPAALLLFAYDWISFGSPFAIGYSNVANPGFAAAASQGIFGATWPRLSTLRDILIGPRGLLQLSPVLVLAPLGWVAAFRQGRRREIVLATVICVVYLIANAGFFNPIGGASPGPRYLTPALPFAIMLVALAPVELRPIVVILAVLSVVLVFISTSTMPSALEDVVNPMGDLWLPRFLNHDLAETTAWERWGMHGLQPAILLALAATAAAVSLVLTTRSGTLSRTVPTATIAALALLIFCLGTPVNPMIPVQAVTSASDTANVPTVGIAAAGLTPEKHSGQMRVRVWAQTAAGSTPVKDAKVTYQLQWSTGGWMAWQDHVNWAPNERREVTAEWRPTGALTPADYRVTVLIRSEDERITYARYDAGPYFIRPSA
jgi:hypothetical protein